MDDLVTQASPVQIVQCTLTIGLLQGGLKKHARRFNSLAQFDSAHDHRHITRVAAGHFQPRLFGQQLDGFGEREILSLDQERKDVAMLVGGKAMIKALLVIDRERG